MHTWAGVVGAQREVVLALDKAGLGSQVRVAQDKVEVVAKKGQGPRELATEVMAALRPCSGTLGGRVEIVTRTKSSHMAVIRTKEGSHGPA